MLHPLSLTTALLLLLLAQVGPSEAQVATPVATLPEAPAPDGLGRIQLPADRTEISALFARLPETVGGETRTELDANERADRLVVAYGAADPAFGPPLSLQALDFSSGDFFPTDFTAGAFVASVAGVPDYSAEAFGRDGNLVWVRATTTAGADGTKPGTPTLTRPIHTLAWGQVTSPWLFTAAAPSPQALDALVDAFVTTASDRGTASPIASPAPGTPSTLATNPMATSLDGVLSLSPALPARRDRARRAGLEPDLKKSFDITFMPTPSSLLMASPFRCPPGSASP